MLDVSTVVWANVSRKECEYQNNAPYTYSETPHELELALFRAREEENRMRMRLNRKDLQRRSKEYAEDGDLHTAMMYHHFTIGPDYVSDCFLSDDE